MPAYQVPPLPASFRATELLHGDDAGFITNAYLALQRHWPDNGGFFHFLKQLRRDPTQRLMILRTLASSETAKRVRVRLEDDLPPDYVYDPGIEANPEVMALYEATSTRLRLSQLVHDSRSLREALSDMSPDSMSAVMQTLVEQNRDTAALLESRLSLVEESTLALREASLSQNQPPAVELNWMRMELARMNTRVQALEQQLLEQVTQSPWPKDEFSELKDGFKSLHWFTTVDLKRLVAEYVIAFVDARTSATEDIPIAGSDPRKIN